MKIILLNTEVALHIHHVKFVSCEYTLYVRTYVRVSIFQTIFCLFLSCCFSKRKFKSIKMYFVVGTTQTYHFLDAAPYLWNVPNRGRFVSRVVVLASGPRHRRVLRPPPSLPPWAWPRVPPHVKPRSSL